MLEMQHMTTLCLQICEDWSWHPYPFLAEFSPCVRHCLLHYWSLCLLLCFLHPRVYWHKQFTVVSCVTCHKAAIVKYNILVFSSMSFPQCIKHNFFCSKCFMYNCLKHVMMPNFRSTHMYETASFPLTVSNIMYLSGAVLLDLKQHLMIADCCMTQENPPYMHDSYRWSEWSGTMFSLIPGVHNMNQLKPAAVGVYMPNQTGAIASVLEL